MKGNEIHKQIGRKLRQQVVEEGDGGESGDASLWLDPHARGSGIPSSLEKIVPKGENFPGK